MANKTCFVVMGFGTKTDYTKPKTFDLDKTYHYIIKPAAEKAGLDCIRADEILHSGNINIPMYKQLLNADVVVADVSTYNCNAFYELGVRHALRPFTTIIISEDGMTFPFDVGQIAIRKYHHLGEGIDYGEVERMKKELSEAMKIITEQNSADSPVYTFLKDLQPPALTTSNRATGEPAAVAANPTDDKNPTHSVLMQQAEEALSKNNFIVAKALLTAVHSNLPSDVFITHKLALATYKAKVPTELDALNEALALLDGLNATDSTDTETLGLLQGVHKRLWGLKRDRTHLDKAIWSSEKGFYLKNDYYNGINLSYLYNIRASLSDGDDAVTDFVLAERTRHRVVGVCEALLQPSVAESISRFGRDATYWVLATLAEAWAGLGDETQATLYLNQAIGLNPPGWMIDSTQEQLKNLRAMLANSPVKAFRSQAAGQ